MAGFRRLCTRSRQTGRESRRPWLRYDHFWSSARASGARLQIGISGCARCCAIVCSIAFRVWISRPPRKISPRAARTPTQPSMPGSDKFSIDHLGIAVRSLDAALEFYEKQLGFEVGLRETVEQERVHVAMLPAGGPR